MKNERNKTNVEVEPVVESVAEPAEETKKIVEPVRGVVTDCMKLNVRELPNPDAPVLTIINALSEVLIDKDESTEDFYKVCTETGVEGYCMKKFIAV